MSVEDVALQTQRLRRVARRHPSAFLLAAQLLSLLVYPLMDDGTGGRMLFGAVAPVLGGAAADDEIGRGRPIRPLAKG